MTGSLMYDAGAQIPIQFQSHVHKKVTPNKGHFDAKKIKAVNDICARTILPNNHGARNEVE